MSALTEANSSVSITLGGWAQFTVEGEGLYFDQMEPGGIKRIHRSHLGRATSKTIDNLQSYLERLRVHAVE